MGSYEMVSHYIWQDIVASYWWATPKEFSNFSSAYAPGTYRRLSLEDQARMLLPGELEPIGIQTTHPIETPQDPTNVGCQDFKLGRISDEGLGLEGLTFRWAYPKFAVYVVSTYGFLEWRTPKLATHWLAVMLPEGAEPLFNADGVGFSPYVTSRSFSVGYQGRFRPYSATLKNYTNCGQFGIYEVEMKR